MYATANSNCFADWCLTPRCGTSANGKEYVHDAEGLWFTALGGPIDDVPLMAPERTKYKSRRELPADLYCRLYYYGSVAYRQLRIHHRYQLHHFL